METIVQPDIKPVDFNPQLAVERASFGDRFFASFADNFMVNIPLNLLTLFFWLPLINSQANSLLKFSLAILSGVVDLVVVISYFAVYAYNHNGQTIAKRWNDIKVVSSTGNDLTLLHFIGRELVARGTLIISSWFIGAWAYLWTLTYLLALNSNKLALHDIIAGTQVIKLKKTP